MIGVATGCAVNPATGSRQLILVSESQEIQMGREADEDIVPALGLVDDPALQEYVQDLGNRMARASERPGLPWTFRVVDDPVVNAFALPGGFVYVTRGILTHFSSEAELAGVVGHEIGHVTARHGAAQMSRAQLAQIGLGVGSILAPDLAPYADLAGAGFQILFLSYGRDAERQADDLGLRYMTALGYEPRAMAATFEMLATASGARDGDRLPGFLSTHPDPLSRRDRILEQAEAFEPGGTVERESYLRRLEGMPFGTNPRNGYFEGASFIHPELAFQVDLPEGWGGTNEASAVQAASPERDAILALEIVEAASPREARERFLAGGGVTGLSSRDTPVNGLTAAWTEFSAQTEEGTLDGTAVFLEHRGRIYQILGLAVRARWTVREAALRAALGSFRPITVRAILDIQPDRITLVRTPEAMTLEEFHERYPSTIPVEQVGTINQLRPGDTIPAGTLLKRVTVGS